MKGPTSTTLTANGTWTVSPACSSLVGSRPHRDRRGDRGTVPKPAYFPIWTYAHPTAIELADRLADLAPGDLNRVFFTTSGSEAVESAWKLARQYFKLIGQPTRHKVISRRIAYHGTTMGALSITGLQAIKTPFEPLVPSTIQVPNTNIYRAPVHGDDPEALAAGLLTRWKKPSCRTTREHRSGLRRAGAELGRLLPATSRLLPAAP